jgi:hypothetical protein
MILHYHEIYMPYIGLLTHTRTQHSLPQVKALQQGIKPIELRLMSLGVRV